MKTTNAVRRVLKDHKPVPQEGVGYVTDGTGISLPVLCACGEGGQSYWNEQFGYGEWLDHVQLALLDSAVA